MFIANLTNYINSNNKLFINNLEDELTVSVLEQGQLLPVLILDKSDNSIKFIPRESYDISNLAKFAMQNYKHLAQNTVK